MNRADRRRAARGGSQAPVTETRAEARMADAGRRLAELCADHARAQKSYETAFAVLALSCERGSVPPAAMPPAAKALYLAKLEALRDGLALMTAGLGVVTRGDAP